jgi:hypothetical protein
MHDSFKQSAMVVGRETRKHGKKKKQWLRLRGIICAILFFLVKIEKRIPMYFTSSRVIAHAHALALPSSFSLSPTLLSPSIPTATTSSQCRAGPSPKQVRLGL